MRKAFVVAAVLMVPLLASDALAGDKAKGFKNLPVTLDVPDGCPIEVLPAKSSVVDKKMASPWRRMFFSAL